jgi:hypothetical protein
MSQFFAQLFVFGALLFAWDVFFAGRALGGSHPDTLAHRSTLGYLPHVVIKSAKAFGFFRLLKRHENSFM